MDDITTKVKEKKAKKVELLLEEPTINNPYINQLIEKKCDGDFINRDISYFLSNSQQRISELSKNKETCDRNIINLRKFLEVLTEEEQDKTIIIPEIIKPTTFQYYRGMGSARLHTNSSMGSYYNKWMYLYRSNNLPYCCGVCEYGGFQFSEYTKVPTELVYNLVIDLIRLTANVERTTHSGAVGVINSDENIKSDNTNSSEGAIINYFIGTSFMKELEKRDDLTFVKEFQNPKTKAKLKMFIFNTKI